MYDLPLSPCFSELLTRCSLLDFGPSAFVVVVVDAVVAGMEAGRDVEIRQETGPDGKTGRKQVKCAKIVNNEGRGLEFLGHDTLRLYIRES